VNEGKTEMAEFDIDAAKKEMEPWYWWGIPTFFKCPWDEDPAIVTLHW